MEFGNRVTMDDGLSISWGTLTRTQQQQVQETFNHLATLSPQQWPKEVYRLRPTDNLYILPVADPENLRMIFRLEEDGRIFIQSMVHQKYIDLYVNPQPNPSGNV